MLVVILYFSKEKYKIRLLKNQRFFNNIIIMNMLNNQLLIVVINIYLRFHIPQKQIQSSNILIK